jgi:hypothetical protein
LRGGAFGNDTEWIISAMRRAFDLYRHHDLDLAMVSYGWSNPALATLITQR